MAKKVKDRQYITAQSWMLDMVSDSKELLAYALIFGFSQDEESEFKGSINYIAEWLKCSRPTAISVMKSLEDKNLIVKRQVVINDITFNRYSINTNLLEGSKEILLTSKETLLTGKESLPNKDKKINNNKTTNVVKENTKEIEEVEVIEDDRFEEFWNLYDKKVGKDMCIRIWKKMSCRERDAAIAYIPGYKSAQPDKQYRKNPSTYLNQKSWHDELIQKDSGNTAGQYGRNPIIDETMMAEAIYQNLGF